MRKMDWAEKVADEILHQYSIPAEKYMELAREQAETFEGNSVPSWCGTAIIVTELRKAYQRGFKAGKRSR